MSEQPPPARADEGPGPAGTGGHLGRSLLQWTLDVVLYAPAGLVLQVGEEFPAIVAKGRDRFELQVENARVVGQFVVAHGRRDLGRRLARPAPAPRRTPAAPTPGAPVGHPEQSLPVRPAPGEGGAGAAAADVGRTPLFSLPSDRAGTAAADAAIEGYDTLSASQVVRRLDGLGADELRAVYRHEASTRNRRTILHRTQQLLGAAGQSEAGAEHP